MHTNLFSNPDMDDITAKALVDLVKMDNIKLLMTDLFLLLFTNESFTADAQKLFQDIIRNYLESEDCKQALAKITVDQALTNEEDVLKGLHLLLMNYLRDDFHNLMQLTERLVINIGWNPYIKTGLED